jgi:hypothetical protein
MTFSILHEIGLNNEGASHFEDAQAATQLFPTHQKRF